ncbi:hypothetical protein JJJ17_16080 [Paracoccus caeni]|uniref:Uncharacterized protein n=1 Tax=Paracoccus caeni TaxID=657651 RepID=A0A934SGZ9_9RHOB|nr:IucA/IucC family protein [Paracoccus caeni]MBK4217448.1 hypothetical protein [Paracoccus caeni]
MSFSRSATDIGDVADHETLRALLTCLIRELPLPSCPTGWRIPLRHGEVEIRAASGSLTGLPEIAGIFLHRGGQVSAIRSGEALALLLDLIERQRRAEGKVLARRIRFSRERLFGLMAVRMTQPPAEPDFLAAEQALLAHAPHPAAQLLTGMSMPEERMMSADWQGALRLHALSVASDLVEATADDLPARLPGMDIEAGAGRHILPVHPLAWDRARRQPGIASLVETGAIIDLGPTGPGWWVTGTNATLWRHDSPFQITASLPIATASGVHRFGREDMQRQHALTRHVAALAGRVGAMRLIADRHWMALSPPDSSDCELGLILRDNPWRVQSGVFMSVSGLIAPPLPGQPSLLVRVMTGIDAESWFRAFMDCSISPVLRLYDETGIGIAADRHNAVLDLTHGLPTHIDLRGDAEIGLSPGGSPALPDAIRSQAQIDASLTETLLADQVFGMIHRLALDGLLSEGRSLTLLSRHLAGIGERLLGRGGQLAQRWITDTRIPIRRLLPVTAGAPAASIANPLQQLTLNAFAA